MIDTQERRFVGLPVMKKGVKRQQKKIEKGENPHKSRAFGQVKGK